MSDVDQASPAAAEAEIATAAHAAQVPPAPVAPVMRSEAQILLDRYLDQFQRLLKIHRRFVEVRGAIVATPAPSAGAEKPEPDAKPAAFFAGLSMIAAADETVIAAIERDVEDLAKLFSC